LNVPLEDYYLWVKMLCKGYLFHNIQESLLFFRCSPAMFRRRGGMKYAKGELRLLIEMRRLGYINIVELYKNIIRRFLVRIFPNRTRSWIYKTYLRR